MAKFGARGQRVLKIIHLVCAGLWIGGAIALSIMVAALGPGQTGAELLGYDVARKFVDDFVVIPGAVGCLFSGLLISALTPWGFFKHPWVAVKWILTVACILFGTFVLGPMINGQPSISLTLGLEALADPVYQANLENSLLGAVLQLSAIVFMVAISVLKPWKKAAKR
jgi:putative copper export protein